MQILIPMWWIWRRFIDKWYNKSKYLLEIQNKTIIEKIISNYDINEDKFIFICNESIYSKENLTNIFNNIGINYKIIPIESHNLWPVYTILKAEEYINNNSPTIVNYCDFFWTWDYKKFKNEIYWYDWWIVVYKWFHPHLIHDNLYAWVKTNNKNELIEIKEKFSYTKDKTKTWQSSWTYYFKSWKLLLDYSKELINKKILCHNEYYVSLLFNLLKKDLLSTIVYEIPYFLQLWTPNDYEEYKYRETIFNPINEHVLLKP